MRLVGICCRKYTIRCCVALYIQRPVDSKGWRLIQWSSLRYITNSLPETCHAKLFWWNWDTIKRVEILVRLIQLSHQQVLRQSSRRLLVLRPLRSHEQKKSAPLCSCSCQVAGPLKPRSFCLVCVLSSNPTHFVTCPVFVNFGLFTEASGWQNVFGAVLGVRLWNCRRFTAVLWVRSEDIYRNLALYCAGKRDWIPPSKTIAYGSRSVDLTFVYAELTICRRYNNLRRWFDLRYFF